MFSRLCVYVLCKTREMVISRRRFAENGKEIYRNKKKHVKGVQSFCFCPLNIQNLWRCRYCRVADLKVAEHSFRAVSGVV